MEHFHGDVRGEEPLIVGLDEECYQIRVSRGPKWPSYNMCQIAVLSPSVWVADTVPYDLKRFLAVEGHILISV